jgi:hypothetical protein
MSAIDVVDCAHSNGSFAVKCGEEGTIEGLW